MYNIQTGFNKTKSDNLLFAKLSSILMPFQLKIFIFYFSYILAYICIILYTLTCKEGDSLICERGLIRIKMATGENPITT